MVSPSRTSSQQSAVDPQRDPIGTRSFAEEVGGIDRSGGRRGSSAAGQARHLASGAGGGKPRDGGGAGDAWRCADASRMAWETAVSDADLRQRWRAPGAVG